MDDYISDSDREIVGRFELNAHREETCRLTKINRALQVENDTLRIELADMEIAAMIDKVSRDAV